MSGPETLRERIIGLERTLDENNLKSMREIALAVADGDQIFAASLLSASAGYVAVEKTKMPPVAMQLAAASSFRLGMDIRGCQCPTCLTKRAEAEKSAADVLKRAASK